MSGETRPTLPLNFPPQPERPASPAAPRRRRRWPWLVALVVVVVLAVAAWFIAESVARSVVTQTVREQAIAQLELPTDQPIDVVVAGAVLPQLIGGTLNDITVSSDDVPLQGLVGDVRVHAQGVPIRGDAPIDRARATVRLDEQQLRDLLGTVEGFPADTVTLAAPNVAASTELSFLGLSIPIGLQLAPSAADGDVVLTPVSLSLGGNEVSADDLQERFGALAGSVVRGYTVCIAQYVPAALTLTAIEVEDAAVVAHLDIDGAVGQNPALQQNGTCR